MTKTVVSLEDKYLREDGQVQIAALQGFVRLLLDQARRDRAAGLKTAGYVTGYRGSPVTTLDAQLWAADTLLREHDIRFEPGLNEELAATSIQGTQDLAAYGKARVEGVFALWYAKGVGVERAGEAIKAANFIGTHPKGGALLLCGDDHGAKSSLTAHQSEHVMVTAMVPTLYPATTEDILKMGQLGWAMSRATGLYVAMKAVTDTLDLTSSVTLPGHTFPIVMPDAPESLFTSPAIKLQPLALEALVIERRLPLVAPFAAANRIDRVSHDAPDPKLAVVSAGKAWLDLCQALVDLGLDEAQCRALGLKVVKLGLVWPIDATFVREACLGSAEVMVVEEKRSFIEEQLARIFYGAVNAPALTGKRGLLSEAGVLDPATVRRALVQRLDALGMLSDEARARDNQLREREDRARGLAPTAIRPAFFCSGCPHNTSTLVPEGSQALGATGCHGLAQFMPVRRTLPTVSMGQEGMPWVGAQTFVDTPHMFQNLGDGTYTHSGLLTIRASVAAKSNVTFKILYNDAVAMTGGQPAEGSLSPLQIMRELLAEGVHPVVLLSEDTTQFDEPDIPPGVRVLDRDELDRVQRELRQVRGTSAIVYDQVCANEKRRRRKRGQLVDPDRRLFINESVCEGCGDCSVQSNCLSVEPVETPFGRKRRINQSSCNKDYSCIKGFCPSFVTVDGGHPARRIADLAGLDAQLAALPEPRVASVAEGHNLLVAGIGGTGVLTVGAVLAMAAQIEGKQTKLLDMTGMAQKGGAVISHLRVAHDLATIPSARVGVEMADTVIACDLVVGSSPDALAVTGERTALVANEDVVPTGEFQTNQAMDLAPARFLAALGRRSAPGKVLCLNAGELASDLLGDAVFTNFVMVGFAAQHGLLPVSLAAIDEALALHGTAVEANRRAVSLGRLAAYDTSILEQFAGMDRQAPALPDSLEALIASRMAHLTQWQDARYAEQYRDAIAQIEALVAARGIGDAQPLLMAAADQLARLMAYKDEYEVARLFTRPEFNASIAQAFDGDVRVSLNFAPPFLPLGKDRKTGRPRKVRLGAWMFPLLRVLASGKRLRGGPFDLFGYSAERQTERALPGEYLDVLRQLAARLTEGNVQIATEIAAGASLIRGYGPVKEEGIAKWRALLAEKLPLLDEAPVAVMSPELV